MVVNATMDSFQFMSARRTGAWSGQERSSNLYDAADWVAHPTFESGHGYNQADA